MTTHATNYAGMLEDDEFLDLMISTRNSVESEYLTTDAPSLTPGLADEGEAQVQITSADIEAALEVEDISATDLAVGGVALDVIINNSISDWQETGEFFSALEDSVNLDALFDALEIAEASPMKSPDNILTVEQYDLPLTFSASEALPELDEAIAQALVNSGAVES